MQLTEDQLFAMYGKAVAESVVLREQLNQLGAELQATNSRIKQLEGILARAGDGAKPAHRRAKQKLEEESKSA